MVSYFLFVAEKKVKKVTVFFWAFEIIPDVFLAYLWYLPLNKFLIVATNLLRLLNATTLLLYECVLFLTFKTNSQVFAQFSRRRE